MRVLHLPSDTIHPLPPWRSLFSFFTMLHQKPPVTLGIHLCFRADSLSLYMFLFLSTLNYIDFMPPWTCQTIFQSHSTYQGTEQLWAWNLTTWSIWLNICLGIFLSYCLPFQQENPYFQYYSEFSWGLHHLSHSNVFACQWPPTGKTCKSFSQREKEKT